MTTGEVAAHVEEVYAARVSKDTISQITEKIVGELAEWSSRPLDPVYPVIFARRDSHVKVRDGRVCNTVLRRDRCHDERGTRHSGYLGW